MDPVTLALAKSWAEGEFGDLRELGPHIEAILDSRIVEMGTNSNGYYARWENGLQVCWKREILGQVQDFPSTFNNLDDRPFPAVFADEPGVQVTVGVLSDQNSARGAFYITCVSSRTTWARLCIVRHSNAGGVTQEVRANFFAIGRWK